MNASLSSLTDPFAKFFSKYHPTIFFSFITLLLAVAIFILFQATQTTTEDAANVSPTVRSGFDEKTAKQIENLRNSNETPAPLKLPSTRNNPFVE